MQLYGDMILELNLEKAMATLALGKARKRDKQEEIFIATQWTLMWRKFRKHKLAIVGVVVIVLFYLVAIFCEFVATHDPLKRSTEFIHAPPQRIHFFGNNGFGPYVYGRKS